MLDRIAEGTWAKGRDRSAERLLDKKTFESAYGYYMPRVFNFVSYRVADQEVAEEITSRVFERALTRLNTYRRDKGAFSTWIFTIARNEIANHFRSKKRQPVVMSFENLPEVAMQAASPEAVLIEAEKFRNLQMLIHELPEREQELLALKFASELSNQEIARVLHMTPTHVGVSVYRTVQKLRTAMERR